MASKGYGQEKDRWFKMLTNVQATAAVLPDFSAYTTVLAQVLEEVRLRGAQLDARRALKQQETKDHQELMRKGRVAAGKLRSALRAHFGFQSLELLAYGIDPLVPGNRGPKDPVTPAPEKPNPENPGSTPPEVKPAPQGAVTPKTEGPAPAAQPDPSPQKS